MDNNEYNVKYRYIIKGGKNPENPESFKDEMLLEEPRELFHEYVKELTDEEKKI